MEAAMAKSLKINSRFKYDGHLFEPSSDPKKPKVVSAEEHGLTDADIDNLAKGGYVEVVEVAE
jgi:hypothetical protein